jgi:hypothetical protein
MIEGGKGGARTKTGLEFEQRINLKEAFAQIEGYEIDDQELHYNGEVVARFYSKYQLYNNFLIWKKINWGERISKRWLPDEAIHVLSNNTMYIIEMKFQKVGGSVDEKLQTCDFKKQIYERLLKGVVDKVGYCYVLSDWFKKKEYKDTLDYIDSVGCKYFFKEVPLDYLGLPTPQK